MIYFESFYGDGLNVDTFSGENSNCSYKDILILIKITDILTWFNLRQISQTRLLLETNFQNGAVLKLFPGGVCF